MFSPFKPPLECLVRALHTKCCDRMQTQPYSIFAYWNILKQANVCMCAHVPRYICRNSLGKAACNEMNSLAEAACMAGERELESNTGLGKPA